MVVKTSVRLEEDVLEVFQDSVEAEFGKLKGAQNEALREAVLLWLAYKRNEPVVILADDRSGRMMVLKVSELKDRLEGLLSKSNPSLSIRPVGIPQQFYGGIISEIVGLLVKRFGNPDEVSIRDLDRDTVIECLTGSPDTWEKRLWNAQDGYEGRVEIRLVWRDTCMGASIHPNYASIQRVTFAIFERAAGGIRSRSTKP